MDTVFSILEDDTTENPERNFPILLPLFFAPPDVKDEVENSRALDTVYYKAVFDLVLLHCIKCNARKLKFFGFDFADSLTVVEYWHTKHGPREQLTQAQN